MKKISCFFVLFLILVITVGCDTQTAELPPADTDRISVADEYAQAFQSLFLNYLQSEEQKLSVKVDINRSNGVTDLLTFYPVIDDNIKCYNDLKSIFTEYCTDEYAEGLLNDALYRDFDGMLYKAESELAPMVTFGCYISGCVLDGNIMTVEFTEIGADNELFDYDKEVYNRSPSHDIHFNMTLVWENEKWLISGCDTYEAVIGYAYRPDITESMRQ